MTAKQFSLMFHRVGKPGKPGKREAFVKYLDYLVRTFSIVLPGDPLVAPVSISLIFDDAYADFYECVFPLLQKYQIKALLAVPTSYISENVDIPMQERLLKRYCAGVDKPSSEVNSAFCSWAELKEMAASGYVVIASHTQNHYPSSVLHALSDKLIEIVGSKKILEQRLGMAVEHFVYPYGDWSRAAHKFVSQYYQYTHRIGNALNVGWGLPYKKLLYRIDADVFFMNNIPIQAKKLRAWWWNALWNRIRLK